MATIALPRPIPPHRPDSTITPPLSLESTISSSSTSAPVPNKHIPVCPTGTAPPQQELDTPPQSPKSQGRSRQASILHPPDGFNRIDSGPYSIYQLDASQVARAMDYAARQPLPEPSLVFPWLHGLSPHNQVQHTFFTGRRRSLRATPACLRFITTVKADGDLSCARLKGAVAPREFLKAGEDPDFIEADPREGFSVRNFQIQPVKVAITSDIVVYGDDLSVARKLAWDVAAAQYRWRQHQFLQGLDVPDYNTFICTSPFADFEKYHRDIVSLDARGNITGEVLDFFNQEKREMWDLTEASEISRNVFMGPTPEVGSLEETKYDILIECRDTARLNPLALRLIAESPNDVIQQPFLDFPSSGSVLPPTWTHTEADGILETCKWIYHLSHGTYPTSDMDDYPDTDPEGDTPMSSAPKPPTFKVRPRKILIHCIDGYTESTMLAIAYYSYSTGQAVPDAWLRLHTEKQRNFFAYPSDVALLSAIAPRLLRESPVCVERTLTEITNMVQNEPKWFAGFDGSFPSRVLNYMYLGNLGHANNPDLLKSMGIGQILSVGESTMWSDDELQYWGSENIYAVQGVQDNGIDPLTEEFGQCLEFIDRGRRNGTATLVHCRVGVSRSATICIAEVMRAMNLSLPRAYCFVRARRLNVIIQPHLRFAYELLRWEDTLQQRSDPHGMIKRELEWGEVAREIAMMNRPYARSE